MDSDCHYEVNEDAMIVITIVTKMFYITLKHYFWEPEVEVILSIIVSFIMLCI